MKILSYTICWVYKKLASIVVKWTSQDSSLVQEHFKQYVYQNFNTPRNKGKLPSKHYGDKSDFMQPCFTGNNTEVGQIM